MTISCVLFLKKDFTEANQFSVANYLDELLKKKKVAKDTTFIEIKQPEEVTDEVFGRYPYIVCEYVDDEEKNFLKAFVESKLKSCKHKVDYVHYVKSFRVEKDFVDAPTTEVFDYLDSEFKAFLTNAREAAVKRMDFIIVDTMEKLLEMEKNLDGKTFAFDTETSSDGDSDLEYYKGGKILCFTFSCDIYKGYFVPLYILDSPFVGIEDQVLAVIKRILQNPKSKSIGQNAKFDLNWCQYCHNITVTNLYCDTQMMWYAIRPGLQYGTSLKDMAQYFYLLGGYEDELHNWMDARKFQEIKKVDENGNTVLEKKRIKVVAEDGKKKDYKPRWGEIPFKVMYPYATMDAIITYRAYVDMMNEILTSPLRADYCKFIFEYCMPAQKLIQQVEYTGMGYSQETRQRLDKMFTVKLEALKVEIIKQSGLTKEALHKYYLNNYFVDTIEKLKKFFKLPKESEQFAEMKNIYDVVAYLNQFTDAKTIKFKTKIVKDIREIQQETPETFNLDSQNNMRWLLYTFLDEKIIKTSTKTGKPSLSKLTMKKKAKESLVCAYIFSRSKLKTTHGMFIKKYEFKPGTDGAIHSSYKITHTSTGRLASSNPNHQQLVSSKKPYDLAAGIKACFIPKKKENIFLSVDYSQLELRVMAAFCQATSMIEAFKDPNVDIHLWVASMLYNKPESEIQEFERKLAKTASFAVVYGASAKSIAENWSLPVKDVDDIMKRYFKKFPQILSYRDVMQNYAAENGFVKNPYGFIRYIPELDKDQPVLWMYDSEGAMESRGIRIAINTPIQGYASQINVISGYRIQEKFNQQNIDGGIRALVHDALVIEVPRDRIDYCLSIIKECMEEEREPMNGCPLKVDVEIGNTYGLLVKYEKYLKDPSLIDNGLNEFWRIQEQLHKLPSVHYELEDLVGKQLVARNDVVEYETKEEKAKLDKEKEENAQVDQIFDILNAVDKRGLEGVDEEDLEDLEEFDKVAEVPIGA